MPEPHSVSQVKFMYSNRRLKTLKVYFFVFPLVLLCAGIVSPLHAQILDHSFRPVLGGSASRISSVTRRADGKLVVAGTFKVIGGARRSRIAVLNTDGTVDNSFDIGDIETTIIGGEPTINSVAAQADNKLVVGGLFTSVNGTPTAKVVRFNADGTIDASFNVGTGPNTPSVSVVKVLPDGKILVGGFFTSFNSQPSASLVRLHPNGTVDQSFSTIVDDGVAVADVAVQPDGKLLVASDVFALPGGFSHGIVRLNENGSLDNTFNPGDGVNTNIFSISLQPDGKILVSGTFTFFNNVPKRGIARLNPNGSLDESFVAEINVGASQASAGHMSVQNDGRIIITGRFINVNGIARRYIARLNPDGTLDTAFMPVINNDFATPSDAGVFVNYLLPDGRIIIGGSFFLVNGSIAFNLATLNPDGTNASFIRHAGISTGATSLAAQPDGKILIASSFTHINGEIRSGVARFNADGTIDPSFNPGGIGVIDTRFGIHGVVRAFALQSNGKIILGGNIEYYNGVQRRGLIRLHPDGTLDTSFPQTPFGNEFVSDILVQPDDKIIVVGSSSPEIFRLNADGTTDTGFNAGTAANEVISTAILQPDGKIIIGGLFTNFAGTARNRIARLQVNGSLDTSFNPGAGFNGAVIALALQPDGKIIAGGNYTTINGVSRNRIARLHSDGSLDTSFDPGTGANSSIFELKLQPDGKILLGGLFNTYNGVNRRKLVRVTTTGAFDATFGAGLDWFAEGSLGASISSLLFVNDDLYVGGNFSKVSNLNWSGLARLKLSKKALFDYDGDGKADLSVFRPSTGNWYLSHSSTNAFIAVQFGASGDLIAPADFDGDGKTDICVFRPSDGGWYRINSSNNTFTPAQFGTNGDLPVPGDFDGDGKADLTVYRPSAGSWYRINSSNNQFVAAQFGVAEDKPLVGDFDGDGKSDLTVFRPSNGTWYRINSATDTFSPAQFGATGDLPVAADYDGDGKTDLAVYRPSAGDWYIINSSNSSFTGIHFGISEDKPAPADFDGDGKADLVVFRPSSGTWYLLRTTAGFTGFQFGATGDIPTPNAFVR
jgi:uncharacterized delta-60 repeat protein